MSLRVLHLVSSSEQGGVTRYVHDLATAMDRLGHRTWVAGQRGRWHEPLKQAPIEWIDAPLSGGARDLWRAAKALASQVKHERIDIVHSHFRRCCFVGTIIARRTKASHLFTLHVSHIPWPRLGGLLVGFGDHTHVPSQAAGDWLVEHAGLKRSRISVVPHGVDPAQFPAADDLQKQSTRKQLGLPHDAVIAAYVGRFDVPKNEQWVIDLAATSRQALPNAHFIMMGGGPNEDAVKVAVDRNALHGRITVMSYGDPLPVYQACDLLLLPSAREGFSLVCAEAMSVGRPAMRTRTAGTEETIVEGINGCSTPIDKEVFIAAAVELMRDRQSLARMGQAGARHVRNCMTHEKQVAATVGMYEHLLRTG